MRFAQLEHDRQRLRDVPSQLRERMRQQNGSMIAGGVFPPLQPTYFDVEGAEEVADRLTARAHRTTEIYREGLARHRQDHPGITEAASIYILTMDSLFTSEAPPQ
jgi:hypothetical protein